MCPVHSEDEIVVNPITKRVSCRECSRVRARVKKLNDRNKGTNRHPRESLIRVPNAALRERYETLVGSGLMTASEIAISAGYIAKRHARTGGLQADIQRLKKQLGVIPQATKERDPDGARIFQVAELLNYDVAERLGRAMGIEYLSEIGI